MRTMVGDVTASLYDFFGYLLPGLVVASGLGLILVSLPPRTAPLDLTVVADPLLGVGFLVLAYLLGHVTHAVMNRFEEPPEERIFHELPKPLIVAMNRLLAGSLGNEAVYLSASEKYTFVDASRGETHEGEREMYVYREGFYRGMTAAFVLLFAAVLLRAVVGDLQLVWSRDDAPLRLSQWQLFFLALGAGLAAGLLFDRWRRFERYRIERAVYHWLAVAGQAGGVPVAAGHPPDFARVSGRPATDVALQPGDIFFTRGHGPISWAIRQCTRGIGEPRTEVNHVGIVVEGGFLEETVVVEALSVVKRHRLAERYGSRTDEVAVYRPTNLTPQEIAVIVAKAEDYVGRRYGWLKIVAHFLDWVLLGVHFFRRIMRSDRYPICSWVVACAFAKAGESFGKDPGAASPDDIWDFVNGHLDKYREVRPLRPLGRR